MLFSDSRSRDPSGSPSDKPVQVPILRSRVHLGDLAENARPRLRQARVRRLDAARRRRTVPGDIDGCREQRDPTFARNRNRVSRCASMALCPASQSSSRRSPSAKMKKSASHLPCGVSSAAHTARPGAACGDVVRNQPLQETDPVLAGQF